MNVTKYERSTPFQFNCRRVNWYKYSTSPVEQINKTSLLQENNKLLFPNELTLRSSSNDYIRDDQEPNYDVFQVIALLPHNLDARQRKCGIEKFATKVSLHWHIVRSVSVFTVVPIRLPVFVFIFCVVTGRWWWSVLEAHVVHSTAVAVRSRNFTTSCFCRCLILL